MPVPRPSDRPQVVLARRPASFADRPLESPGVDCPVLRSAIEDVERLLIRRVSAADLESAARLLPLVARAIGNQAPTLVVPPSLRHRPVLVRRVLDLVRAALLHGWTGTRAPLPMHAVRVLHHITAIEALGAAVERDPFQDFGALGSGRDSTDALAEVLHDLRSPLSSILFLAERMARGGSGPVTDLQRRQLRLIHIAALQLGMVADDAVDAAHDGHLLAGEACTTVSVTRVFNAVADIVRPMAEEKALELRFVRPAHDRRIAPEQTLQRVLLNLVTNALKFTHSGWVEVVALERGADRIEFGVRDTGRGISAEAAAKLFRVFRDRRDGTSRAFSRTGLGLVLCRRLVQGLGGTLRFECPPEEGGGTRFWFEVNLARDPAPVIPP